MVFIPCTENCIYQANGECRLERALPSGGTANHSCVYFVPKAKEHRAETFSKWNQDG